MLCSLKKDIQIEIDSFFEHLINRTYNPSFLEPYFSKVIHNAITYRGRFFKSSTLVNNILRIDDVKTIKEFSPASLSIPATLIPKSNKLGRTLSQAELAN